MTALTTAQFDTIRQNSGDNDEVYEVSNAALQAIYDSSSEGNSDLNRTVYYVILRRLGLAAKLVSEGSPNTGLNTSKNQKFEQLERLLKLWGSITGIGGGVSIGSSSVFTYRADSLQTEAPTYSAVED